ncbi:hypothetical protein [Alkalihalobacillus sp. CinArs1]|uniref:hypothetical protein n=1 Tax=Alkalihalobacillus sp. CinArs1 TaxID=2995314 RepID=UPI0022DE7CB0|nr:hypothetical protein [Alkalihalobacillus sp. CinArs1]
MDCGCNSKSKDKKGKCDGCVCSILRDCTDNEHDLCKKGTQFFTILFGDPTLNIGGLMFKNLDEKTCCATFVDMDGNVYIFDCRKLHGISSMRVQLNGE